MLKYTGNSILKLIQFNATPAQDMCRLGSDAVVSNLVIEHLNPEYKYVHLGQNHQNITIVAITITVNIIVT